VDREQGGPERLAAGGVTLKAVLTVDHCITAVLHGSTRHTHALIAPKASMSVYQSISYAVARDVMIA